MTEAVVIFCSCGTRDEALRIGHVLVEERLAACVNILPEMHSVYRWRENIESACEIMLLIKTTQASFPALRDRITELHSYDTPEIIAVSISQSAEKYLAWIVESVVTE